MIIPTPAKSAANNPTVLAQLTPPIVPGPAPSASAESDSLVLLGLRKDAELEGKGLESHGYKPSSDLSLRRGCLYVACGLAGVVAIAVVLVAIFSPQSSREGISTANERPQQRQEALTKEEKLLRKYILNNAADSGKVEFIEWGPHMTASELLVLWKEGGIVPDKANTDEDGAILRLVFNLTRIRHFQDHDEDGETRKSEGLYFVGEKKVTPIPLGWYMPGPLGFLDGAGPDWKKKYRKNLAKEFPAIKVD
jgi:hypothetical protein